MLGDVDFRPALSGPPKTGTSAHSGLSPKVRVSFRRAVQYTVTVRRVPSSAHPERALKYFPVKRFAC